MSGEMWEMSGEVAPRPPVQSPFRSTHVLIDRRS
jgi:hypothetical protein